MSQCISCRWIVMHRQPKGKGVCFREQGWNPDPRDVLVERKCSMWELGAMAQVHGRSHRRMKFDEQGKVRLE